MVWECAGSTMSQASFLAAARSVMALLPCSPKAKAGAPHDLIEYDKFLSHSLVGCGMLQIHAWRRRDDESGLPADAGLLRLRAVGGGRGAVHRQLAERAAAL